MQETKSSAERRVEVNEDNGRWRTVCGARMSQTLRGERVAKRFQKKMSFKESTVDGAMIHRFANSSRSVPRSRIEIGPRGIDKEKEVRKRSVGPVGVCNDWR